MSCSRPWPAARRWSPARPGAGRGAISAPEAGLVLDAVSPEAIAAALARLLADPPARHATRAHAEGFGWDETTRGQVEVFDRVLAARGGRK